MTLLREIQADAINSSIELTVLLRKCKVLAARLGNPEFKQWVENELNGYKGEIENLPDYRVFKVLSKGHFSGPFGSGLRNVDIPLFNIPEKFKNRISHIYLKQPVAALESLTKASSDGTLQESWDADLLLYLSEYISDNMQCVQAWKIISTSAVIATLDAIRNKILNFVLDLEEVSPDAGEALANTVPIASEKVNQIFYNNFYGSIQNVATGNNNVTQHVVNNSENEKLFADLLNTLSESKEDKKIITELSEIIEEMRAARNTEGFKGHYLKFMSLLSDHATIFSTIAPYIPTITALLR